MTARRMRRLAAALERRQPDLTVLLDEVHKPHNLAAVVRTCDAVGVPRVHAVARSSFSVDRAPSAGVARWVEMRYHATIGEAVTALRGEGVRVYAAHHSEAAVDFRQVDCTRPTAFLLGAEKEGVSDEAADWADGHVTIPMHGLAESLNVSVAAAILLYEAERQRADAGFYEAPRLDAETRARKLFEWLHPRLAAWYRERGQPYPELDEDGQPRPRDGGA